MPIKKIVVAYHEAGHAVVARRFGVAVNRIATGITGGGPFGGRWFTGSTVLDPAAESRASLRQRLWIALAGAAAQNRYDPHDPHTHRRGRCASDDYERARKLYAELHRKPDCNDEDLLGYESEASKLVAENWSAIDTVATELFRRRSLKEQEVDALLESLMRRN